MALHLLVDEEQYEAVHADADEVGGDAEGFPKHLVAPQEEAQAARDDGWSARVGGDLAPEQAAHQGGKDGGRPQLEHVDHQPEHVLEDDGHADGDAAHDQRGQAGLAQELGLRSGRVDELVVDVAGVDDRGRVDHGRARWT